MSDFLISMGPAWKASALLDLLGKAYGPKFPGGRAFDYPWGSVVALFEKTLDRRNVCQDSSSMIAAVGDLVADDFSVLASGLSKAVTCLFQEREGINRPIAADPSFSQLNGAFGVVLASATGPAVITDPLGGLQIYAYRDGAGSIVALGTHPDLVARIGSKELEVDPVSAFEFLNVGTPCFPHTMHTRVHELAPGHLHVVRRDSTGCNQLLSEAYWQFPDEFEESMPEDELAARLRSALLGAVEERTRNRTAGITLSGGLDSRLLMAAVPRDRPCLGFTFCDVINREAQLARRVARCYERPWFPLFRDAEYVARTALDTVRFIGCECEWVHAHGIGFVDDFARHEVSAVLHGLGMNNTFKLWFAADIKRIPRLGGLLPPRYEMTSFDYVNALEPFRAEVFAGGLLEAARERRRDHLKWHPGMRRQSKAEWLSVYPTSQDADNAFWVAERRLLPIRLPAQDRRLLDIACRVPALAKVGNHLFVRMANPVFGRGARIPNANDGVRPGSGHVFRLIQRAIRELQSSGRNLARAAGLKTQVPHSWHDYPRYWRESDGLARLIQEHGENLREFEGQIFASNPRPLLDDKTLHWEYGFHLVQLALWRSVLRGYGL